MNAKREVSLKQTLLDAALQRIEQGGTEALSLRKLAKDAGVTTMATYHHFANKKALLVQIAIDGFSDLEKRITIASENADKAGSSAEVVEQIMKTYFTFASERPHLYNLMFGYDMTEERHTVPEFRQAAQSGFYVLARAVKGHMHANGHELDLDAGGMCFWAILHGRVSLAATGTILDEHHAFGMVDSLMDDAIKNVFHIN